MTRPSNSKICWRSLVKHCATKRSQKHWDLWVKADPIFRFCKMLAKYQDPVEAQILSDSTTVWRRGVDKSQEQKTTDGSLRGLSSHSASFINKGYVSKNAPWSWTVFKRNKRWSFHVIIRFISIYIQYSFGSNWSSNLPLQFHIFLVPSGDWNYFHSSLVARFTTNRPTPSHEIATPTAFLHTTREGDVGNERPEHRKCEDLLRPVFDRCFNRPGFTKKILTKKLLIAVFWLNILILQSPELAHMPQHQRKSWKRNCQSTKQPATDEAFINNH